MTTHCVVLPNGAADAPVEDEWHSTTFVNYLRIALRWSGFPGFERYRNCPITDLAFLAQGLRPI